VEEVQIGGIGTEGGRGTDRWREVRKEEEVQIGGRGTEGGGGTDRWKRY